jgi:putative NADPH-quinone reductase
MARRIAIIQGHPAPSGGHFCHALAAAYAKGAKAAGHEMRLIDVAALDFPFVRSKEDWEIGMPPLPIIDAQRDIRWAEHLVIIYPLWLGAMPAMLNAFLEQALRPGFAMRLEPSGRWTRLLGGRSARIVVTMGMPALAYRWLFRAHSLKALKRNILNFTGVRPCRHTLIGMVEKMSEAKRRGWLDALRALGAAAR